MFRLSPSSYMKAKAVNVRPKELLMSCVSSSTITSMSNLTKTDCFDLTDHRCSRLSVIISRQENQALINSWQLLSRKTNWQQWGLCALRHGIQISMEAILACHPARSTEWLDCHPKSCELWRIRTGPIGDNNLLLLLSTKACQSQDNVKAASQSP